VEEVSRFLAPATIVVMVTQIVALGLVIWRVSRWRRWLAFRQLLLVVLFVFLAVMIWNLGVVVLTPPPGR
jgi:hypothetical protein